MKRNLTVRAAGQGVVSGVHVELRRRGETLDLHTDSQGRVSFDWPDDWMIEIALVDGVEMKHDWDITGGMFSGPSRELELSLTAGSEVSGRDRRRLKVRYRNSQGKFRPVSMQEIVFWRHGEGVRVLTDASGHAELDWPDGWVADKVEIEQLTVAANWDPSGRLFSGFKRDIELDVPDPEDAAEDSDDDRDEERAGVRGQLFYHDGTQVSETHTVSVTLARDLGERYATDQPRSYCKTDGSFFIATRTYQKGVDVIGAVHVDGAEIPRSNLFRNNRNVYYLVLPQRFNSGGGQQGGLILGRVVGENGKPVANARVKAEMKADSIWSLGFAGDDTAETHTNKQGFFALHLRGGVRAGGLLVDGEAPLRISTGLGDQAQDVPATDLHAGTRSLTLVRRKRLLDFA